ncbi:bifunctional glycosyltransferase family 2/GtrA family protein [Anaerosacchariphilus polymeriproducens]|uniref:Glycosyltransferase n=1 Tax=Anaerosacchariphilus polymeriproducens TaxID=1812858 RepID=A0A371AYC5_9FIRM|nr:bifunctional glycosyltransferase family 2/GtrA family protein [Anaerosacchariphilus polymeriproducens]RDU24502.1 glycosyltransferase [Anaerosacchariphilus polymeriproducens]
MDIAIIPAFDPDEKLISLVYDLHKKGIRYIVVVDDGSTKESQKIWKQIENNVILLTHEENKGKGIAIKTALAFISTLKDVEGIVILDADGQHRPVDALRLLHSLHENHSKMVLGVRRFDEEIPVRSLFGNTLTKYVFRLFSGTWVSDTQTGLRAFSIDIVPELLKVSGKRYEYEMNVLLTCAKKKIPITEVPIATIYHDSNNSCSHFRAVQDSARIYGNILAFSCSSLFSFLLDYILFFLFVPLFNLSFIEGTALICANICARLISGAFNYYLNSTFIFRHKENRLRSITNYALLACFILALNTAILYFLNNFVGMDKALAKLTTEAALFSVSFTIQKFVIFKKKKKEIVSI